MVASLDELKSSIATKGGLARPNNFVVELPPLAGVSSRDMNILCRQATLPAKQIVTHERRIGMEFEKIAYGYAVDDVSLTFLVMNDYGVKQYFDTWKDLILNEDAHTANYKEEYQKRIVIHQLANSIPQIFGSASISVGPLSAGISRGFGFSAGGRIDISTTVYSCELINAFPTTIGEISFNNDQDAFIEMTVQMSYTNWKVLPAGQKQVTFTLF